MKLESIIKRILWIILSIIACILIMTIIIPIIYWILTGKNLVIEFDNRLYKLI